MGAPTASVIVTLDSGYVGDDAALLAWLRTRKLSTAAAVLNSDGQATTWEQVADLEYAAYLATSGNQYAFMDIAVDGQHAGRLLLELFATKLPKTTHAPTFCSSARAAVSTRVAHCTTATRRYTRSARASWAWGASRRLGGE